MKFEITSWISGSVLFSAETESMRLCVELAVKSGANLRDANLRDANLRFSDLRFSDLSGADLSGADLSGANGDTIAVTDRPLIIGPIGPRADYMTAWQTDAGIYIKAGCFLDTLAAFEAAVTATHGDNEHAIHYRAAIALIRARFPEQAKAVAA